MSSNDVHVIKVALRFTAAYSTNFILQQACNRVLGMIEGKDPPKPVMTARTPTGRRREIRMPKVVPQWAIDLIGEKK